MTNYWFPVVPWKAFEWHKAKAKANFRRHGVSFELAKTVFTDPFAIELIDDREDRAEERFVTIGMADGEVLLFVSQYGAPGTDSNHFSPKGNAI